MSGVLGGLKLFPVSIPMVHRFRSVIRRDAVIVKGPAGWGEFSPFPEYGQAIAAKWLAATIEAARDTWPPALRSQIPINVTVPAVPAQTAFDLVVASGCRTAKVKVAEEGQNPAEDEKRLAAVRDAIGPDGKVRVDVNAAWDLETAVERLRALDKYDLEYAEQPVRTIDEMIALRRRVPVPIAADEVLRMGSNPLEVAERGAADILVLKVQPLGGVAAALALATKSGLPCVVSSALETSVGIAAGLALAAALPSLPFACGLGTVSLLVRDVVAEPLYSVDGRIALRRPAPDEGRLERLAASPEVAEELLGRMRLAAEVLV